MSLPIVPAERMTGRARAYLWTTAGGHLLLGLACMFAPGSFTSESYTNIKQALPVPPDGAIVAWGVLFFAAGVLAAYAAYRGREGEARWALLASVLCCASWGGGFIAYVVAEWQRKHELLNPSGAILWTVVTILHITMLRSPLRNPFERVMRRAMSDARAEAATAVSPRHRS